MIESSQRVTWRHCRVESAGDGWTVFAAGNFSAIQAVRHQEDALWKLDDASV